MAKHPEASVRRPAGTVFASVLSALWLAAGCSASEPIEEPPETEVTYWKDVAPLVQRKCVGCHQEGGVAPFPLDTYEAVATRAGIIDDVTQRGVMPPFLLTHDGSCGDIQDEEALTAQELETLHHWATGTLKEGTPVTLAPPSLPSLEGAVEYRTPSFVPQRDPSNPYAAQDEYRCFILRPELASTRYISGYQIVPGNAAIVHHVAAYRVDPSAPSWVDGQTNGQVMDALDAASPDRDGWSCLGAAGDGVQFDAVPAVWAPGQNVVAYPQGTGIPLRPGNVLVVQVHYNLAGLGHATPQPDSTTVRLRLAERVERQVIFLQPDPLLASLFRPEGPDALPPGLPRYEYSTRLTRRELDIQDDRLPPLEVLGIMPHMHERGRQFELSLQDGSGPETCIARVDRWDFHWQMLYWYRTPPRLSADTLARLTCTFDTTGRTEPVLPGWGTENEMCLASIMVALPPGP